MSTTPSSVCVWTPPSPRVATPPPPVHLKIENDGTSVIVYAVNEDGIRITAGQLVKIGPAGLYLYGWVNTDIGLPLGKNNRLAITETG